MASGQSRAWLPNTSPDEPDAMQAIASFGGLWVAPGSPYQSMSGVKTHFTSEAISKGARSGTVKSPDGPLDVTLGNPLEARIETRGPNPDGLAVELHALLPDLAPDQAQRIMEEAHQTCPYSKALRGEASVALIADTPALEKILDQDSEVIGKLPAGTRE